MNYTTFSDWLDLYGQSWRKLEPSLIETLFVRNATYSEGPFKKPMSGIEEIAQYWKGISQTQQDVQFNYEILAVSKDLGVAHFKASFFRKTDKLYIKLDGIMTVSMNSEDECIFFSEWWQSQKTKHA